MRALLVVNPNARQVARYGGRVRGALEARGIEVRDDPADADVDAIIVAGGDGTVIGNVEAAIARRVPIGIVPLGTFNDLARTLSIPLNVDEACDLIAQAHVRTIDVARVNGVYYVNEASIGLSSRLVRASHRAADRRLAAPPALAEAVAALRYLRPFHANVRYGDRTERMRTIQLTVANSHRFGGFINVDGAAIDDGWLDLYALDGAGYVPILSLLRAVFRRRGRYAPGVRTLRAAAFAVWTSRPHRITADGEEAGTTPARFEVLPKALGVFAPEKNIVGEG